MPSCAAGALQQQAYVMAPTRQYLRSQYSAMNENRQSAYYKKDSIKFLESCPRSFQVLLACILTCAAIVSMLQVEIRRNVAGLDDLLEAPSAPSASQI